MAWNREKPNPPSSDAARAPRLRKQMTDAEPRLWAALRREIAELPDTHFRRQVAIGPYVADFVCGRRLIIEVDGKIHEDQDQRLRDAARDTYLGDQGFRVMHFSNTQVMLDMPLVLRRIGALVAAPTPSSSPQGAGELETGL